MECHFRYARAVCDTSTNLHLFETINGTPRGDARGPVISDDGGRKLFDTVFCKPVNEAFAAAIRLASQSDTEIVVSGDRRLWCEEWGELADE